MRNVIPEKTSQNTACEPWDETATSVSRATIAAIVKKTRSQQKSDLRSLRFSARTSADVSSTANAYPPCCVLGSWAEPEAKFEPAVNSCQGTLGEFERRYTPADAGRIRRDHRRRRPQRPGDRRLPGARRPEGARPGAPGHPGGRRGERAPLAGLHRLDPLLRALVDAAGGD